MSTTQRGTSRNLRPRGARDGLEYDINEIDLLRVKQWNGTAYKLLQESGSYVNNQPGTVTDAAGQTTIYTYNASGQLETITTPERAGITETRTTTYEYDLDGYLESVSDPAKGATTRVRVRWLWPVAHAHRFRRLHAGTRIR